MTTELTKAAQQALKVWDDSLTPLTTVDLEALTDAFKEIRRALTQRPAAQTWDQSDGVCKGAWELGTACGKCAKCIATKSAPQQATPEPIPMVLHCPKCAMQHIDAPEPGRAVWTNSAENPIVEVGGWKNPPHRSHLCHKCGTIWRPADVPTTGVKAVSTKGKADTWEPGTPPQQAAGEPVAWMHTSGIVHARHSGWPSQTVEAYTPAKGWTPLYTRPAPGVPEWVVNDLGELGVKAGGRFFFLYKGDNIEYGKCGDRVSDSGVALHDDGTPMRYRTVGKVEFGETCWPVHWVQRGYRDDRYALELVYEPGLSDGTPQGAEWRFLPAAQAKGRTC